MQEKPLLEMTGSVEHIVFRNDKNGYTILEMNNGEELVTVVGSMPWVNIGEDLQVFGTWVNHPNFGTQFKVDAYERSQPKTAAAMLKYLSSGAIKGIGAALAARVVEAFGENTLEVIQSEPQRLTSVKGITRQKAEQIGEEFQKAHGIREMMLYLGSFGITPEESVRVWKLFGPAAAEQVQEDPYCLCDETLGIGFSRADEIAASLERPQDDICRVRAAILHVLKHNTNNGHTYLPKDKLLATATALLGVEDSLTAETLEQLKEEQCVVFAEIQGRTAVFLEELYRREVYISGRILMMLRYSAEPIPNSAKSIQAIEQEQGIEYAQMQKLAIQEALSKGMLILTGGPGTGKTTTLNAIIQILKLNGEKVLLAAPTGRAAKRMSELTGEEAKTLHRLLQVEWDENDRPRFAKNEKNLLDCDALVIDELSMVDVNIFEAVLRALPLGCRLILVGDSDQLPSVGPGNILHDLVVSNLLPVVQLNEIFRQSMKSLIVTNAHRIVHGEMPQLQIKTNDFFFLPCRTAEGISATIVDLCATRLPKTYQYSPYTDIQVLTPGRKGELGTYELNKKLQAALNPPDKMKNERNVRGMLFREGDKIMQVKNDYNLSWVKPDGTVGEGVYNGDLGILTTIDSRASVITVEMDDGRVVLYEMETAMNELELAYAMTVHKSQGNEFPAVVIPMFPGPRQLYYRNLLYTAITRAKQLLILVGTAETVETMVRNARKTKRFTGLSSLLVGEAEG